MSQAERALYYIFILSLILIVIAYFTGASQVLSTLGSSFKDLISVLTGRNPQTGQFAGYPTGTVSGATK